MDPYHAFLVQRRSDLRRIARQTYGEHTAEDVEVDLLGFFDPVVPGKMALRQRGAHEEEPIQRRADGRHPARGRRDVGGRGGQEAQGQRADHPLLAQAPR